jgi:two-component system response regulator HydG
MTRRALVVDDDQAMVRTLTDILQLNGWQVRPAYSGEMAVDAAAHESFDVVLMDVKMPGLDGVDAFKAMKQARPDIRVILMTAYAAPDRVSEAERAGVVRVLSKPVNVAELFQLLAKRLDDDSSVLIIDDDTAFLHTLAEVLQIRGYEVATAEDLAHAKRLVAEKRPLAVLLHLRVANEHVRETVAEVHAANPDAAIVLYSGSPDAVSDAEHDVPRDWVYAYLQKPFAVHEVTDVLDQIRHGR